MYCLLKGSNCTVWKAHQGKGTRVAVGQNMVWMVNGDTERIFKLENDSWKPIKGELTEISVGVKNVWGVIRDLNTWYYTSGEGRNWKYVDNFLSQVYASLVLYAAQLSC